MLVLTMRVNDTEDRVIIRDSDGRKLCEISMQEVKFRRAEIGYESPPDIQINRRPLDRKKYPDDYPEGDQ